MKKILLLVVVCVCLSSFSFLPAKGAVMTLPENWEMVNAPTAYTLIRGSYSLSTRIYEGGGLFGRWNFGFMGRLLLGVGFTVNNVIGSGDMSSENPRLGIRLRIVDEDVFPSIAVGWDQRGYGPYDGKHFLLGEKGAYLALSKELGLGGAVFQAHGGANVVEVEDFDAEEVRFFVGAIVAPVKEIILTVEGDDLFDEDDPVVVAEDGTAAEDTGRTHNPCVNAKIAVCFDELLTIGLEVYDLANGENGSRMLMIDYKNYF